MTDLRPGMTKEEIRQWRIENWTKEDFASVLMTTEASHQDLIQRHSKMSEEVLSLAYKIIASLKD